MAKELHHINVCLKKKLLTTKLIVNRPKAVRSKLEKQLSVRWIRPQWHCKGFGVIRENFMTKLNVVHDITTLLNTFFYMLLWTQFLLKYVCQFACVGCTMYKEDDTCPFHTGGLDSTLYC